MERRQLQALVAIADHGTFSAAADALLTVQSNISTHVARLERELGAVLVDRRTGALTEAGEAAVARARRVEVELGALAADVAATQAHVVGQVRLGVIGTTARWLVPRLLATTAQRHPGVRLVVVEATSTSLLPQVEAATLDFAVVNLAGNRRLPQAELEAEPLFDEDLLLIVPADHRLAGRAKVRLADLNGVRLFMPPTGTAYRADLDAAARAVGITLTPEAELDGLRLIASMTIDGHGAAILPASALPPWLEGPWRRIPVRDLPRRTVGLARRRRYRMAASTQAVVAVLHDLLADPGAAHPGLFPPSVSPRPTGR